jgi:hypothetical protein
MIEIDDNALKGGKAFLPHFSEFKVGNAHMTMSQHKYLKM